MNAIEKLQRDADRCSAAFADEVNKMTHRLQPRALANSVVGLLDPEFTMLRRLRTLTNQKPLALLAALAGLMLLTRQISSSKTQPKTARPLRHARRVGINPKG